jgi:hypothetical protein
MFMFLVHACNIKIIGRVRQTDLPPHPLLRSKMIPRIKRGLRMLSTRRIPRSLKKVSTLCSTTHLPKLPAISSFDHARSSSKSAGFDGSPSPTVEDDPEDQTRAPNALDPSNPALFEEDLAWSVHINNLSGNRLWFDENPSPTCFKVGTSIHPLFHHTPSRWARGSRRTTACFPTGC